MIMKRPITVFLGALILLVATGLAYGKTVRVHLKDGRKLSGEIVSEDASSIKLKLKYGVLSFKRSDIKTIEEVKSAPKPPKKKPVTEPAKKSGPVGAPAKKLKTRFKQHKIADAVEKRFDEWIPRRSKSVLQKGKKFLKPAYIDAFFNFFPPSFVKDFSKKKLSASKRKKPIDELRVLAGSSWYRQMKPYKSSNSMWSKYQPWIADDVLFLRSVAHRDTVSTYFSFSSTDRKKKTSQHGVAAVWVKQDGQYYLSQQWRNASLPAHTSIGPAPGEPLQHHEQFKDTISANQLLMQMKGKWKKGTGLIKDINIGDIGIVARVFKKLYKDPKKKKSEYQKRTPACIIECGFLTIEASASQTNRKEWTKWPDIDIGSRVVFVGQPIVTKFKRLETAESRLFDDHPIQRLQFKILLNDGCKVIALDDIRTEKAEVIPTGPKPSDKPKKRAMTSKERGPLINAKPPNLSAAEQYPKEAREVRLRFDEWMGKRSIRKLRSVVKRRIAGRVNEIEEYSEKAFVAAFWDFYAPSFRYYFHDIYATEQYKYYTLKQIEELTAKNWSRGLQLRENPKTIIQLASFQRWPADGARVKYLVVHRDAASLYYTFQSQKRLKAQKRESIASSLVWVKQKGKFFIAQRFASHAAKALGRMSGPCLGEQLLKHRFFENSMSANTMLQQFEKLEKEPPENKNVMLGDVGIVTKVFSKDATDTIKKQVCVIDCGFLTLEASLSDKDAEEGKKTWPSLKVGQHVAFRCSPYVEPYKALERRPSELHPQDRPNEKKDGHYSRLVYQLDSYKGSVEVEILK
jgi:hypothetical protein